MVLRHEQSEVAQMFQTVIDEYEVFGGAVPYDNNAYYAVDGCLFSYSVKPDAKQERLCSDPGAYLKLTEIKM